MTAVLDFETYAGVTLELQAERRRKPERFYIPNPKWQRPFHDSRHTVRCMFLGNRAGKTTGMGIESARTLRRPGGQVLWFAPQLRQFDILKAQLDADCLDQGYSFNSQDNLLTWPHGSKMWVIPADRDWTYIQGVNPDLICIDEEPPQSLWTELQARGFGAKNTRYVIAATATNGVSWMRAEFYKPWLEYHKGLGLNEDAAIAEQLHPWIFVIPRGGIYDNPSIPKDKADKFASLNWGGPKQAKVRIYGGFENWIGDPVFDEGGMAKLWERLRASEASCPGRLGFFEVKSP